MKTNPSLLALWIGAALGLGACQNTMMIGEDHGVNVTAEVKTDVTDPVHFNCGFNGSTAVVVPPKKPLTADKLRYTRYVPGEEPLSSAALFRVVHTGTNKLRQTASDYGSSIAIQSSVASGSAANTLFASGSACSGRIATNNNGEQTFFEAIAELTKNPNK